MRNITYAIILVTVLISFGCKSKKQQGVANEIEIVKKTNEQKSKKESSKYAAAESKDMESPKFAELILVSLSKTPCFGACPSFNFTVFANGTAQYDGLSNVARLGKYKAKINKEDVNQLLNEASAVGYFSLKDKYDSEFVSDVPSATTYLNLEGKEKKVICRYECDDRIKKVNKMIEVLIEKIKWKLAE